MSAHNFLKAILVFTPVWSGQSKVSSQYQMSTSSMFRSFKPLLFPYIQSFSDLASLADPLHLVSNSWLWDSFLVDWLTRQCCVPPDRSWGSRSRGRLMAIWIIRPVFDRGLHLLWADDYPLHYAENTDSKPVSMHSNDRVKRGPGASGRVF